MRHAAGAAGLAVGLALVLAGGPLMPARASSFTGSGPASHAARGAARAAADPASLAMTASVSPSPLVVGEPAVYTMTVRNNGDAAASNVTTTLPFTPDNSLTVDSPLPAGCTSSGQTVTCNEATIPAGGSVTYQIPVTVLPGVSDGTNIALRALATADGVPGTGADVITPAFTRVDVEIGKTGPATVSPGGTITYTITVTNHGPSDASTVTWHDPTDGNQITITSYPCGNTGLTVTCDLGTLAPGETRTFTITATVNPDLPAGTVIPDCAVVYTGTSPDTDADNNQSCVNTTVTTGQPPVSDVEVAKTAPPTVEEDGTVTYTVSATNHGPDPATNVIVSDPISVPSGSVSSLPPGCVLQGSTVTCEAGTLAVGETKTVSFSVKVGPGVAAGTNIMNCAAVTSTNDEIVQQPNPFCVQTLVVPPPMAEVAIAKTGPATAHAGDTYSYTLTVTNAGPDEAAGVVVTDPTDPTLVTVTSVPDGCTAAGGTVTCDAGTLAPGETKVFTITVRVNDNDPPGTVIENCAKASSDTASPDTTGTQSCTDTTIDPVVPVADVEVTKSGPATVHAGDTIEYTLSVTNHGPDDATNVVVEDPLDPSLVTVTPLPSDCAANGSTIACEAGSLAVGETKTVTVTVTVADGLPAGTQIDNCAQATSDAVVLNPIPQPSCVQTTVVPPPTADISLTKAGPATVAPDGTISYPLTVTNKGPDDAAGVVVTDPTDPSLVTITSLPPGCTQAAGTVTCVIGSLAAGETRVLTITVQVNPGIQGVVIPNCAQDYTDTFDPDLDNNQSCVNTAVDIKAAPTSVIEVAKQAPAVAQADGTVSYSVTVTNKGPDDATGVVVTDPVNQSQVSVTSLPAGCVLNGATITCLAGTLAVGESKTFTYTVTVASDVQPGTRIDNCAAAGSSFTETTQDPSPACAQTLVLPPPVAHLTITKTAPRQVQPDGTLSYTLSVTNHGPADAAHALILDPIGLSLVEITSLPGGCRRLAITVICDPGQLAADETKDFTIEARVRPGVSGRTVIGNCTALYSRTYRPNLSHAQSCVNTVVMSPFLPVTG
jgi:uncharacterized repeat protein (TIGR01451 family)